MNLFSELIPKVFAESLSPVIGTIVPPPNRYGDITGLGLLLTNILRVVFVVAGIVAFFNFIIAGFSYMMAGGDAKAMQAAWDKIWYSLLGLILMVGSFALAAVFGYLIFGDPTFMLHPRIYTP